MLRALRSAFHEATSIFNVCGYESDWADAVDRFCASALFREPVPRPTLPLKLQIIQRQNEIRALKLEIAETNLKLHKEAGRNFRPDDSVFQTV